MHYHSSSFLSVMCKCSYIVTTEGDSRHRPIFAAAPTFPGSQGSSTGNLNTARVIHPSSRRGGKPGTTTAGGLNSPTTRNAVVAGRGSGTSPRISLVKRSKLKRRVTISSGSNQSTGDKFVDETDWPPFADEDYIVFCFEEDGAFHVVMEESPKPVSQIKKQNLYDQEEGGTPDHSAACACNLDKKASYHFQPPHSRRDCLLANKEVDEERFLFSPRFDFHEGRDRIVDDIPELDFDEIKSRDPSRDDDDDDGFQGLDFDENKSLDQFEVEEEVERRNSSMECCNGSVESSNSSQSGWSPKSQGINREEGAGGDNEEEGGREEDRVEEFETGLSESSEPSQSDMGDEKLEDEAEVGSTRSRESSRSNSSASSFTFPVSQWEWIGSPETWPRTRSLHLRKIKPRPVCLRCCGRF